MPLGALSLRFFDRSAKRSWIDVKSESSSPCEFCGFDEAVAYVDLNPLRAGIEAQAYITAAVYGIEQGIAPERLLPLRELWE